MEEQNVTYRSFRLSGPVKTYVKKISVFLYVSEYKKTYSSKHSKTCEKFQFVFFYLFLTSVKLYLPVFGQNNKKYFKFHTLINV